MKKKVIKKIVKASSLKRTKSIKSAWHKALPVRWSFFSISIMTILAALAIVLPSTGVLGASTGPVQVSLKAIMKNGTSVTFTSPQGLVLKITQTTEVNHKRTTKTIATQDVTSLPTTYPFAAANGSSYTITLTALSSTPYTVLNGHRVINVKNGKTECDTSTNNEKNPCTFLVMKKITGDKNHSTSNAGQEKDSEDHSNATARSTITCTGKCVPTTLVKKEHLTVISGTCQPTLVCTK